MSATGEAYINKLNAEEDAHLAALAVREPLDIFSYFDHLDDIAIVDELEGRLVETAVYHFPQEGKELWGLSKVGVDWCITELSKKGVAFRDEELTYAQDPTDPTYILFTARVGKHYIDKSGAEAKVESKYGTKRQWTKMKKRSGEIVTDPFWFEKGSQKAIRNASMRLIPEETKAAIIAAAKQGGRVREVKGSEAVGEERGQGEGHGGIVATSPSPAPPSPATAPLSKFHLLKEIGEEKGRVGDYAYYGLLMNGGFKHADEVPPPRRDRLLELLRKMEDAPVEDIPDEN